ncbi:helix-turn-helix domain-containing protein [Salinicoccus bachuensis]|uniref:Helix-turn-helix domain-containing protein n=1 Tax=Salinicoccus bachuensis TaxID=3136731 RepID=A0ABZ3CLJ9_9STAP
MTTIKELSEELSVLNMKLVAGYMGVDKTVDYITILELPEKTGRFKTRGLVLSTFQSFRDVEEIKDHMIWLKSLGIAGIGFHTAHYKSVPDELIHWANEADLPLFSIPSDVPYHRILDIFNEMENKDLNLRTYEVYRINDKLMESVSLKKDSGYILNLVGNYIKETVILLDAYLKIKGVWKKPTFSQEDMDALTASLTSKYKKNILQTRFFKRQTKLLISSSNTSDDLALQVMPISANGKFYGYLIVNTSVMDNIYVQEVVKSGLRAIAMSAQSRSESEDHYKMRDFKRFEAVLEGRFDEVSPKAFHTTLSDLKYCVRADFTSDHDLDYVFQSLSDTFLSKSSESLLWIYNGTLIAFMDSEADLKKLSDALAFHSDAVMGVSARFKQPTLYDLQLMNEQAEIALAHGREREEAYVSWSAMGIEKVTRSIGDMELFRALDTDILGPIIDYDNEKNGHLLETLECCLKHFFNLKAASESLYVHSNTVKYRLKQITRLLKLDIRHPSHFALLVMAFEIHHSKHEN